MSLFQNGGTCHIVCGEKLLAQLNRIKSSFAQLKYSTAIFWVLALPVSYFISRCNYNLFHSIVDGVSIVITACVFTIIWNGRRIVDNDYFLYVGIAFLFFAFWDFIHLLGNKNMGVFPEYGNLGPALYIVSRYFLSISLLVAPLFINRKLNTTLMFALYSLVSLFLLLSIFYWHIFPVCIVEGVGLTPFKVLSDYIICLILLGAIGPLLLNHRSFDSGVLWMIVSSIILSIATGVAFAQYADPFGLMNAIGHFLQIASFYLVYIAFIKTSLTKPQEIFYLKLKQNEEELSRNLQLLNYANVKLKQEIAEHKLTAEALRESAAIARTLIDAPPSLVLLIDTNGNILGVNLTTIQRLNKPENELLGVCAWDLLLPEVAERRRAYGDEVVQTGKPVRFEDEREGIWHDNTYWPVFDENGKVVKIAIFAFDITERKQMEVNLRALLLEKEVLLKEVHHRVKNNLAAIMGLLDIQGQTMDSESARTAMAELSNRIRSMALVHEQLYRSENFSRIKFQDYLESLIAHIQSSYASSENIHVSVTPKGVVMGLDDAVPCGLLLTELVTNALKYAFPEGRPRFGAGTCEIAVSAEWDGQVYTLTVADNGVGMPAEINWMNTKTMGLSLVKMLGEHQLQGRVELDRTCGTTFRLRFAPKSHSQMK
ncbi:MAG: MASE3 domain-containing protein [Pseudomonadota bacterium]